MKLIHIIRCHSKGESNYKNDFTTPVYCTTFLPSQANQNCNQRIFCTGGAHKICFIDCIKGKVLKIFQASPTESFYCLSSSYIPKFQCLENKEIIEDSVIVAAAGKQGNIKLIHYQRNECYLVLHGHQGNINEISFSPKTSYHLLSKNIYFSGFLIHSELRKCFL